DRPTRRGHTHPRRIRGVGPLRLRRIAHQTWLQPSPPGNRETITATGPPAHIRAFGVSAVGGPTPPPTPRNPNGAPPCPPGNPPTPSPAAPPRSAAHPPAASLTSLSSTADMGR